MFWYKLLLSLRYMGLLYARFTTVTTLFCTYTHKPYHYYHIFSRYKETLAECQEMYVQERESLIGPSVKRTLNELSGEKDTCSLLRSASAFLLHVSLDEHALYSQFFSTQSGTF